MAILLYVVGVSEFNLGSAKVIVHSADLRYRCDV